MDSDEFETGAFDFKERCYKKVKLQIRQNHQTSKSSKIQKGHWILLAGYWLDCLTPIYQNLARGFNLNSLAQNVSNDIINTGL